MAGLQAPLSTLRLAPRDALRMTRGQAGLLFLFCYRLSLFTLCRSPGALAYNFLQMEERPLLGMQVFLAFLSRQFPRNSFLRESDQVLNFQWMETHSPIIADRKQKFSVRRERKARNFGCIIEHQRLLLRS